MGIMLGLLVAVSSFLTAPLSNPDPRQDSTRLEKLIFSTSLSEFVALSALHDTKDDWFDWTSDYCSAPLIGNTGRSFDFTSACLRHDFAYRNYKLMDKRYSCPFRAPQNTCPASSSISGSWWNSKVRLRIDNRFRDDMLNHCATRTPMDSLTCQAWATIFYKVVRIRGGP